MILSNLFLEKFVQDDFENTNCAFVPPCLFNYLTYSVSNFRLHYTWIDIGTPNVSFLVALDVGSDLLWVPCDCLQCAPLSASYYSSLVGQPSMITFLNNHY